MTNLRISEDLALPVDAATQTILIVGKRGSGKSTTAARNVEQLLKAKVPVAILDPVDSWWGLKAARDGVGQGHSVYVFGGRHADLPLEPGAGALIAEFLCEHRAPVVLSCKHMSGLERSRFMVDFALTLFRKWTGGVLHLVLEEAHELAPQAPPKGEKAEEMLGAFKRLWKLGRSSGIGGTAITQRPASLHKDITTQSEILVVHRTIGPQDVEAVRQWIKYHNQGEEILPELAHLKTGEAFVWAPEFPEDEPIGLRRVQVLPRDTFDSSSTPKHGEQRAEPGDLAAVDLEKLRTKMAATIERAKAEDPRELRKTIAELRAELKRSSTKPAITDEVIGNPPKRVEVPILKDAQIKSLAAAIERLGASRLKFFQDQDAAAERLRKSEERVAAEMRSVLAALAAAQMVMKAPARATASGAPVVPRAVHVGGGGSAAAFGAAGTSRPAPVVPRPPRRAVEGSLPSAQQRIVDALGWLHGVGIARPDKTQVALFADLTPGAGHTVSSFGALRSAGLIDYPTPGTVILTEAGRGRADASTVPQGVEEMQRQVLAKLPSAQRRILEVLLPAYPAALAKDDASMKAGLVPGAGHTVSSYGRLRSLGLIDYPTPGQVVALPVLFLE